MGLFSNVTRDFWFSALKIHCYMFPTKFFLNHSILKQDPLLQRCLACFATSVAVPISRNQMLNVGFFQHVFPKIRVLCKIMVGLSTEFKKKWKLVEHYCTVLCSRPVDQQKKE